MVSELTGGAGSLIGRPSGINVTQGIADEFWVRQRLLRPRTSSSWSRQSCNELAAAIRMDLGSALTEPLPCRWRAVEPKSPRNGLSNVRALGKVTHDLVCRNAEQWV
jgi:hypothetical protein